MTIETKFSPGDRVIALLDGGHHPATIRALTVHLPPDGEMVIRYGMVGRQKVANKTGHVIVERDCISSEQELIDRLKLYKATKQKLLADNPDLSGTQLETRVLWQMDLASGKRTLKALANR